MASASIAAAIRQLCRRSPRRQLEPQRNRAASGNIPHSTVSLWSHLDAPMTRARVRFLTPDANCAVVAAFIGVQRVLSVDHGVAARRRF